MYAVEFESQRMVGSKEYDTELPTQFNEENGKKRDIL